MSFAFANVNTFFQLVTCFWIFSGAPQKMMIGTSFNPHSLTMRTAFSHALSPPSCCLYLFVMTYSFELICFPYVERKALDSIAEAHFLT